MNNSSDRVEAVKKLRDDFEQFRKEISEQKWALGLIKNSLESLLGVLNNLDAFVYVADLNSREIIFANDYLLKSFGEVVGKPCWEVLRINQNGPCTICKKENLLTPYGDPKEVCQWEFFDISKSISYEIRCSAMRWMDGRLVSVGVFRDITKKKEALERLDKHARDLEEANKLKELFTDIMRHDLINPAGIISGFAEARLIDSPDDNDMILIKRNAEKLVEIIENASVLLKLEAIKGLDKKIIDLHEVIKGVVRNNSPLFESVELEVVNNVKKPLHIRVNKIFEEVILNLLTNAAKYASDGGKVIIDSEDLGTVVRIRIRDFGPGVADEDKERIFTRFERREKKGVKGIGLGLTIAKRIMEYHKGGIWVEDNPAGGCVFVIELPKN